MGSQVGGEFYLQIATGKIWELVAEDEEWYTDTVCRCVLFFENVLDREDQFANYSDLIEDEDFVLLSEMGVLARASHEHTQ